jgi:hypothetical protein
MRIVALSLLSSLAACTTPPDNSGDASPGPQLTSISLTTTRKADLLFMIDNSPSMSPKQAELKARFPELLKILQSFGQGVPIDYHIGVVTSDLGAGPYVLGGGQCHPGGDGGRLQALGKAADPTCKAPTGGVSFIEYDQISGTNNLPPGQDLATTFGCMASTGDTGCGFEQQLESVYKALHDNVPENAGFLRPDALLGVLWLTDEDDDCSIPPDSDLFDPGQTAAPPGGYGALLSYRGTEFGVSCDYMGMDQLMPYADSGGPLMNCHGAPNPSGNAKGPPPSGEGKCYDVSRYIDFFTKPASQGGVKVDPTQVVLAGIVAPATPVQSLAANPSPSPPGPYASCSGPIDGMHCAVVVQHSCIAPANTQFFGDPAVRITQVISAVPPSNQQLTSICDTSYQSAMQHMGSLIVSRFGPPGCLPSPPADPNAPNCAVEDVTINSDGTTTTTAIPACADSAGAQPCWSVQSSAQCGGPSQQLVIQRNGSPPPNTLPQAACQLAS